jgi:hypothetical protein
VNLINPLEHEENERVSEFVSGRRVARCEEKIIGRSDRQFRVRGKGKKV